MGKYVQVIAAFGLALACLSGCTAANEASSGALGGASSVTSQASAGVSSASGSLTAAGSSATAAESGSKAESGSEAASEGAPFASWNADAASLEKLVSYVAKATEEGGEGYIAPEDRVAVFDLDGTFFCERGPVYADYMLLLHRAQDDPDFTPSAEMSALCDVIRASADKGQTINDADRSYKKDDALAEAFDGMTPEEFHAYVKDFMSTEKVEGFYGMTYGESFYKPMLEVISYLQDNDFKVYVVTACEREVARPLVEALGIEPDHVIGSDWSYEATHQGETENAEYTYVKDDELVLGGEYQGLDGNTNKVISIQREIGKHPVLAFGNSSGDFAMLNYTLDNGEHPAAAFLVIADDAEREYGDAEKAADMLGKAEQAGWTPISMKDDWATIYGEGVTKTQLRADGSPFQDAKKAL